MSRWIQGLFQTITNECEHCAAMCPARDRTFVHNLLRRVLSVESHEPFFSFLTRVFCGRSTEHVLERTTTCRFIRCLLTLKRAGSRTPYQRVSLLYLTLPKSIWIIQVSGRELFILFTVSIFSYLRPFLDILQKQKSTHDITFL